MPIIAILNAFQLRFVILFAVQCFVPLNVREFNPTFSNWEIDFPLFSFSSFQIKWTEKQHLTHCFSVHWTFSNCLFATYLTVSNRDDRYPFHFLKVQTWPGLLLWLSFNGTHINIATWDWHCSIKFSQFIFFAFYFHCQLSNRRHWIWYGCWHRTSFRRQINTKREGK